jgi:hypothetical protein
MSNKSFCTEHMLDTSEGNCPYCPTTPASPQSEADKLFERWVKDYTGFEDPADDLTPENATSVSQIRDLANKFETALTTAQQEITRLQEQTAKAGRDLEEAERGRAEMEGRFFQVASHYASVLISFSGAGEFFSKSERISLDKFGGCRYCGRFPSMGHLESCELIQFKKTLEAHKTSLATRPQPPTGGK